MNCWRFAWHRSIPRRKISWWRNPGVLRGALRAPHSALLTHFELFVSSRIFVCRRDSGGDRVLFAEAQAGREVGVEHVAVAEVHGGDAGQCAVSKAPA